jgi:hypothetical protein
LEHRDSHSQEQLEYLLPVLSKHVEEACQQRLHRRQSRVEHRLEIRVEERMDRLLPVLAQIFAEIVREHCLHGISRQRLDQPLCLSMQVIATGTFRNDHECDANHRLKHPLHIVLDGCTNIVWEDDVEPLIKPRAEPLLALFLQDLWKGFKEWLPKRGHDVLDAALACRPGGLRSALISRLIRSPIGRRRFFFLCSIRSLLRPRLRSSAVSMKRLVELMLDDGWHLLLELRHGWLERLGDLFLERLP